MAKKRVYKKGAKGSEYDAYHGKPLQKKRRAERNAARNKALKSGAVHKGDGKEVDHQGSHRRGSLANVPTRVVSREQNRSRQPKRS
jgi:hypothetical protein